MTLKRTDHFEDVVSSTNATNACEQTSALILSGIQNGVRGTEKWGRAQANEAIDTWTSADWTLPVSSNFQPYAWKKYRIGNNNYDLVVYRRPRRNIISRLFSGCC